MVRKIIVNNQIVGDPYDNLCECIWYKFFHYFSHSYRRIGGVKIDIYYHQPDSLWGNGADGSLSLSLSFFSMHAPAG